MKELTKETLLLTVAIVHLVVVVAGLFILLK